MIHFFENSLFLFTISVILLSYLDKFRTVLKHKSSEGISLNAHIITLIASSSLAINAIDNYVFWIGCVEVFLCAILTVAIYKFRREMEKINIAFGFSLFSSCFMVHGVMQAITSYKNKGFSSESVLSYLLYIALDIVLIILSDSSFVISALIASSSLYVYIIIDTIITNKKFELVTPEVPIYIDGNLIGYKKVYGGFWGAGIKHIKRK